MASVLNLPNGRRAVQFFACDGQRRTIRLGKLSKEAAAECGRAIDALVAAKNAGQQAPRRVLEWLTDISDELADRLARLDVIPPRRKAESVTLAAFIDGYLASRGDLKPGTLAVMQQARVWLVRNLGEDCRYPMVSACCRHHGKRSSC